VAGRVRSLQTGASAELTVLAVLPGADREAELHQRFRHLHVRGEWFRPGPDLLAFVEEVNRGQATGPLVEERSTW
jgi:Meiotically up-regulated gene 113